MNKILEEQVRSYTKHADFRSALGIPQNAEFSIEKLAQGECNVNFCFLHPVSEKKLVLRVNLVSQMHLADQIGYEFTALCALSGCGRTPKPLYLDRHAADADGDPIGNGLMVYEYLPGCPLDYRTDLGRAAKLLADIHSYPYRRGQTVSMKHTIPETKFETAAEIRLKIPAVNAEKQEYWGENSGRAEHRNTELPALIPTDDPLGMILDECEAMVQTYYASPLAVPETVSRIRRMLKKGHELAEGSTQKKDGYRCIINTELNSGNFLMNNKGTDYLIDWEKPLYGAPAQDLGHFLAPTTTFWKTDVILTDAEIETFTEQYIRAVRGRFDTAGLQEELRLFLPITCLRGITWCAMAWVQYQDPASGAPKNLDTWKKLCAYLSDAFLGEIERRYFS